MRSNGENPLRTALNLIRGGNSKKAHPILVEFLRGEPNNAQAWFLLSYTLDDPQHKQQALIRALRGDPQFERAQTRLQMLRGETGRTYAGKISAPSLKPATPAKEAGLARSRPAFTSAPAIRTRGLTKFYGSFQALHGVDLEVRRGEIFGFLGPNGAGKTTTIRSLLDLIHRDGGTVEVLGIDPQKDPVAVRRRVGYMPGELHLDNNLTAEGLLRYFNDLRGRAADWSTIRKLAERLDLKLKQPIRNLSHGNKQKVGIVQTLMHHPELILMDEPTQGLDPLIQQEVLHMLKEAQADGATVFFSSHIISEVEAVAQRVGIIRAGRMVEVADPKSLGKRSLHRVHVRFKQAVDSNQLARLPGVRLLSQNNGTDLFFQIEGEMDGLIKALAAYPVSNFATERPSLEEIFLAYYEGK